LFCGILLLILTNLTGIIIPIRLKEAVDLLLKKNFQLTNSFIYLIVLISGLALLMALIRIGSRVFIFGVGRKIESREKQRFFEHLLSLDYQYFSTQRTGDLISRATNDIQAIRQMMGFGVLNVINIIWVYSFTLPLMFSLSPGVSIFVMLGYLPILSFVYYLSFRLKLLQAKAQKQIGDLSSFLEEDLNGIQVIKSYSQEEREILKFKSLNQIYLKVSLNLAKWRSIIWPVLELAKGVSFFVLLYFVSSKNLSVGTIAALLVCIERLVFPTTIMGWLITIFQRGSVSVERIEEIYKEKSSSFSLKLKQQKEESQLLVEQNSLRIKDLSFSFDKNQKTLDKLNLELPENFSFVGVVGPIGCGKTTLTQCITRLLNIKANQIFILEQDILEQKLESLKEQVCLVPQEPFLFNSSIRNNLSLFSSSFSTDQIDKVIKLCEIKAEIEKMPRGLETIVGEKGVSVSGGQAQRIALARSILLKPKARFLILDDSMSSIDNEIALKILENIKDYQAKQSKKQTLILITHRFSVLKRAELIYVFSKQGKIDNQGKHQDLIKTSKEYQKLYYAFE